MAIIGICGKMGNKLYDYYKEQFVIIGIDKLKHKYVSTFDTLKNVEKFDIVVDFSSTDAIEELKYAILCKKIVISGTTGYKKEDIDYLYSLANGNFYWSCNFAKGITTFMKIIDEIKPSYQLLDFVEIHASTKKDAPSGTAKMLSKHIGLDESKIQSIRLPLAPAIHEIIFSSNNERIIIRHEVIGYNAFIDGLDLKLREMIESVKKIV
ncbi:MAG: dihydrodipicolinate reductase C-terminal domain-containing protein [Anaeroplasma sp.]